MRQSGVPKADHSADYARNVRPSHRCRQHEHPNSLLVRELQQIFFLFREFAAHPFEESVGTPEEAGVLLAFSTRNFSTIDFTLIFFPRSAANLYNVAWA